MVPISLPQTAQCCPRSASESWTWQCPGRELTGPRKPALKRSPHSPPPGWARLEPLMHRLLRRPLQQTANSLTPCLVPYRRERGRQVDGLRRRRGRAPLRSCCYKPSLQLHLWDSLWAEFHAFTQQRATNLPWCARLLARPGGWGVDTGEESLLAQPTCSLERLINCKRMFVFVYPLSPKGGRSGAGFL